MSKTCFFITIVKKNIFITMNNEQQTYFLKLIQAEIYEKKKQKKLYAASYTITSCKNEKKKFYNILVHFHHKLLLTYV